jgi:asparagine synthase (glutamine-hydrolysing)
MVDGSLRVLSPTFSGLYSAYGRPSIPTEELLRALTLTMKIRNGQTKWLIRQVLYKYVPPELVDRPKSGFGVPIHGWLRGPLREWAEELLDPDRLCSEGFFDPLPIRRKCAEHLSGRYNWMYPLECTDVPGLA